MRYITTTPRTAEYIELFVSQSREVDLHDRYDDYINEMYDHILDQIPWISSYAADLMKREDPTAYNTGFNDWSDGLDDITEIDGAYYEDSEFESWVEDKADELRTLAEEVIDNEEDCGPETAEEYEAIADELEAMV